MRVERLPPERAGQYLAKAEEFMTAAEQLIETGAWNAAGLEAVHAVISTVDSLTILHLGVRSRGPDHRDVLSLVERLPYEDANEVARRTGQVIDLKNVVEYEARSIDEEEARAAVKVARRLVTRAREAMRGGK